MAAKRIFYKEMADIMSKQEDFPQSLQQRRGHVNWEELLWGYYRGRRRTDELRGGTGAGYHVLTVDR